MAGSGRIMTWVRRRPERALLLLGLLLSAACVPMAEVVQGKVTAVRQDGAVILVQNERAPDAPPLVIDVRRADMGVMPVAGDVVRVAYRTEGDVNRAVRIMNITRDRERKRSGH